VGAGPPKDGIEQAVSVMIIATKMKVAFRFETDMTAPPSIPA
jgi:hypothetical protein